MDPFHIPSSVSEQHRTICSGKLGSEAHGRGTVRTQEGDHWQAGGQAGAPAVEASGTFLTLGSLAFYRYCIILGDLVLQALL